MSIQAYSSEYLLIRNTYLRIEIKLIIIFSGNMWGEGLSHCGKRNPPGVGLHGVHRYLRIKYPSGIVGLWDISSKGQIGYHSTVTPSKFLGYCLGLDELKLGLITYFPGPVTGAMSLVAQTSCQNLNPLPLKLTSYFLPAASS